MAYQWRWAHLIWDRLMSAVQQLLAAIQMATYATWDPANKNAGIALSNGNLTAANGGNNQGVRSTIGKSSGKWYWEISPTVVSGSGASRIGGADSAYAFGVLGVGATEWAYLNNGNAVNNNSSTAYGLSYTTGDVIGIALDMDAGTITFYKNGSSQGLAYSGLTGTVYAAVSTSGAATFWSWVANFGASAFAGAVPSGYHPGLYS